MAQDVNLKITVDAGQAEQSTNNYKKTLKSLKDQMVELQVSTNGLADATDEQRAQYAALEQQAGQLSDALSDVSSRVRANADDYQTFNAALEGLKGGAAVAQGLVGTLDLLGVSNTGAEKVVKTLMSLQGVMNSINVVQQIFNKDSKLMIALQKMKIAGAKNEKVAMEGAAVATTAEAGATTTATVATRSFTAALMSNPFGLIAVAIATVTTAIIGLTGAMDDDTSSVDSNTEATEKNTASWTNNAAARREALKGYASLLSDIENKGVSQLDREGALLEFVTGKLGVQVNSVEEARKVYEGFKKSTDGITQSMEVFYKEGTQIHREFTTLKDAALSHANALRMLKDAQEDYKEAAESGVGQDVLDDLDEEIQKWEANSRYAEQMLKMLEQKTVGYYKTLKKEREKAKKGSDEEVAGIKTVATETENVYEYIGALRRRVNEEAYNDEEKTYEGRKKHYEEELRLSQEVFDQEVEDMKSVLGEDTEEYQTWLDLRETMLSQHLENVSEAMQKNDEEEAERRKRENEELQAELDRQEQERIGKQIEREQRAAEARQQIFQGLYSTLSSLQEAELADENLSEKEKLKIQKRYAISNLLINLAESGVALATSIPKTLEAYADIPFAGPILAAVQIAATTASVIAQIAKINQFKQQISKAARGAYVVGPSHAEGGVMMELEGGEAVLNRRAMAIPEFRSMASAMNVATGGVPFGPTTAPSPFVTKEDIRSVVQETVRGIAAIPVVVSEQQITNVQRKVGVMEGMSRL